ncbi:MAG: hypothetical protein R3E31_27650 [Chloroflexota bacterium]
MNDAAVKDLLSEEIAQLHKLLDQIANTLTDAKVIGVSKLGRSPT